MYVHVCMYGRLKVGVYVLLYVRLYVCVCMPFMHVSIYACMYLHICTYVKNCMDSPHIQSPVSIIHRTLPSLALTVAHVGFHEGLWKLVVMQNVGTLGCTRGVRGPGVAAATSPNKQQRLILEHPCKGATETYESRALKSF